ncbi:CTB family bacteriocin [Nodularia sphaerocarpa]|uniref:CTB family bacteriocin n=1 Tax=Nodularia sphaerocarpa TaxID=137816 RepID=UPI001EFA8248|nr:CTB family bacteriocin [Nodularia sphaerocarpa]MDB9373643.1 CTB family bacteriocin [Nodularia sphaerocarpa CS-585]MDB9380376.1 CTB family bacteriocin [Nodularia sphaerocarpa CS-585A2]ULP73050.1 hypothetical protein BDGGKGIB_02703 [Nodularia sphaerocarpa UHCC 0038]
MSNPLFNELSPNQQESVAGGFSLNFSATLFSGLQTGTVTNSASNPGGSTATGENASVAVDTAGSNLNGLDIPADFDLGALFGSFFNF